MKTSLNATWQTKIFLLMLKKKRKKTKIMEQFKLGQNPEFFHYFLIIFVFHFRFLPLMIFNFRSILFFFVLHTSTFFVFMTKNEKRKKKPKTFYEILVLSSTLFLILIVLPSLNYSKK